MFLAEEHEEGYCSRDSVIVITHLVADRDQHNQGENKQERLFWCFLFPAGFFFLKHLI